ncbi:MAG: TM2 domain-containing protein [Lachnospiraceae bacterium]|nr:TM2 domain-containing protein [Lachnospiraceae bacterium]
MKVVKDPQCPFCGAPISIAGGKTRRIVCEYCRSELNLEAEREEPRGAARQSASKAREDHGPEEKQDGSMARKTEGSRANQRQAGRAGQDSQTSLKNDENASYAASVKKQSSLMRTLCIVAIILGIFCSGSLAKVILFVAAFLFYLESRSPAKREERIRQYQRNGVRVSPKNKWTAFFLCLFLGGLGIHHFYVGRVGRGIACLLTVNFFGIGWLFDMLFIICGRFKDFSGAVLI